MTVVMPLTSERGVVWLDPDGARFLPAGSTDVRKIANAEVRSILGPPEDSRLRVKCDPDGCGPHGDNKALYLSDGGKEQLLARHLSEIHGAKILGEHIYWVTYGPYGGKGELSRVSVSGGKTEVLREGDGIHEMLVDGDDVFVASGSAVVRFDTSALRAHEMTAKALGPKTLKLYGGRLYWAEHGDRYWKSDANGAIRSAPRDGGEVVTHAHPVRWPSVLRIDDARIYWGREDGGELFAVPLGGGNVETVADLGPGCGGIVWSHSTGAGLLVMRGDEMSMRFGQPGEIWLLPTPH